MSLFLYSLYAVIYGLVLIWTIRIWMRNRRAGTLAYAAIIFGLLYDNGMLALGNSIGVGDPLYYLSLPRFILHQLVLPWIIFAIFEQVRQAGAPWAQRAWARPAAVVLSVVVMGLGILTRLVGLQLEPTVMDGVTRYVAVNTVGPPLVSIIGIGLVGVLGITFWRRLSWPWITILVVLVFIGEMVPSEAIKRVFGSAMEVALMTTLLWTQVRLDAGVFVRERLSGARPALDR
jgi:hypothetical protein